MDLKTFRRRHPVKTPSEGTKAQNKGSNAPITPVGQPKSQVGFFLQSPGRQKEASS